MDPIIAYFMEEKKITAPVANLLAKTILKYEDINCEFCEWLCKRELDFKNPVVVEGYSAKQISEINPELDVAGVYNFLVTLREKPEKAKGYIEKGFPQK